MAALGPPSKVQDGDPLCLVADLEFGYRGVEGWGAGGGGGGGTGH